MCVNPVLVFDIARTSPPIGELVLAVSLWLLAIGMVIARDRPWFHGRPLVMAAMLLVAGLTVAALYWFDARRREQAIQESEAEGINVEGIVDEFVSEPYSGHSHGEQFKVAGHLFRYSYYDGTPFFHTTATHGGPLRSGLKVRIVAVGHRIARLEVCDAEPTLGGSIK
jgi:hypothetical protein